MNAQVTQPTKASDIKRAWHFIDVKGKTLGRIAGSIALLIMGKNKPYFAKNMDCGDYVVVVNAKYIEVSGNKEDKKTYTRYSGYPGGLKRETFAALLSRKPEEPIRHAVAGMLPKNRLRAQMLKRLYIFAGEEHEYQDKFKIEDSK